MKSKVVAIFLIVFFALGVVSFHFRHQFFLMVEDPKLIWEFLRLRFRNLFALLDITYIHLFVDLAIVLVVFAVEYFVVGWKNCSMKKVISFKSKSILNDVFYFLLSLSNSFKFFSVIFTFALGYFAFGIVSNTIQLDLGSYIGSPLFQFIVVSLFGEFMAYWVHRSSHFFSLWWMAHRVHHSADEMSTISYYRIHFIDSALAQFFKVIPFVIFGQPIENYFIYYVFSEIHNLLIHSEIKSNWGWIGRYVFVSPLAHRIHHSANKEHYNSNYSNFFIFWDRWFGTYKEAVAVERVGLEPNSFNKRGIVYDVIQPYKDIFRVLFVRDSK
ncbi:MAG: sterol desaturase family protein [Flavobacteriales bacterium]